MPPSHDRYDHLLEAFYRLNAASYAYHCWQVAHLKEPPVEIVSDGTGGHVPRRIRMVDSIVLRLRRCRQWLLPPRYQPPQAKPTILIIEAAQEDDTDD